MRSIRLSKKDEQELERMAEQESMTVSDVIRDMIRKRRNGLILVEALREIKTMVQRLEPIRGGNGPVDDIAEIKRIVTLIARAMPAIAKHV